MIADEDAARSWVRDLPECDGIAFGRLERFAGLLAEENRRQNLVAAASLDAVWQRHIADSAQLLRFVPRETASWLDLGSGGGFPGLVIACLRPQAAMVLVESRGLRADWLVRAASALALSNVRVEAQRIERVDRFTAQVISARAFAPLDRLLSLSAGFSTGDTLWLLPKGRSARQELTALCDWRHTFHVEPSLTDAESGIIVGTLTGRKEKRA